MLFRSKWLRRYSDVATVVHKINDVTYIIKGDAWRSKEKIVHVDKLKLKFQPESDMEPESDPLSDPATVGPTVKHLVSALSVSATPFVPKPPVAPVQTSM